jgi:hypothetical protein
MYAYAMSISIYSSVLTSNMSSAICHLSYNYFSIIDTFQTGFDGRVHRLGCALQ